MFPCALELRSAKLKFSKPKGVTWPWLLHTVATDILRVASTHELHIFHAKIAKKL